jgi:hypothetical protein
MNEYYQLKDLWAQHVQDFKDSEDREGITKYDASQLAQDILRFIRYTYIRQFNLFSQQRGEEFEKMIEKLQRSYDKDSISRFLDNEELWKITLELGME